MAKNRSLRNKTQRVGGESQGKPTMHHCTEVCVLGAPAASRSAGVPIALTSLSPTLHLVAESSLTQDFKTRNLSMPTVPRLAQASASLPANVRSPPILPGSPRAGRLPTSVSFCLCLSVLEQMPPSCCQWDQACTGRLCL